MEESWHNIWICQFFFVSLHCFYFMDRMEELSKQAKVALIRGFLKKCDWIVPNAPGEDIGYSTTLDKFDRFKEDTGYDFSILWDELSDQEQFNLMHECSGLHKGYIVN